ncbi:MAG: hypothetical protein WBS19_01960 [Candidatus Korobacteraceae bacterium]
MRRVATITVLLVLLTPLLAPLAQASTSSLPACCRAGGRHHCEMAMGNSEPTGFTSAPTVCPFRIHAAVTSPLVALASSTHLAIGIVLIGESYRRPTEVTLSSNPGDELHQRGPPAA